MNVKAPLNPGVDVLEIASPYFFGGVISFVMLGITIVQGWTYWTDNRDSIRLRLFILSMLAMDLAGSCLLLVHLTSILLQHFGSDPQLLLEPSLPLGIELLLNLIIILAIDTFLANQIRNLNQTHWSVPIFIVVSAACAFVIVFSVTVGTMISETFATTFFVSRAGMATIGLGNVLYTIAELVATVALAWSFYKSKTGIRRTDSILTRLFGWFVTRGILLSIVQVLSLALYLANPLSFIWVSLHFLQSKFYVITTLSLLNSRKHLRRRINIFDSAFSPGPTGNDTRNTDSESSQAREGIVMDISASHDTNEESVQSPTLDKDVESCLTIPDSPLTIRTDLDQDGFEMSSTATEPAHRVPRVFISREQITTSI